MRSDGERHDSLGAIEPGTKWALAEGRVGGPLRFRTYFTLANLQSTAATVTVTYLREAGAPVEETYTIAATSRLDIDSSEVPGLQDSSFGAVVTVTNDVPIVVERSMYWSSNDGKVSSGTSALATRLP